MSKREVQESKENLEVIENGAPKARYQTEQQVQNTMDVDAKVDNPGFVLKKQKANGSQLKQEAVAKVINNADSGSPNSGMGISAGGLRGVSGTAGGILGAANGTPIADKSRSNSRYGKKLDRIATKLNYTPSEQVVQEYDESKPLAEARDLDQGYNGTYRNEYARSQKKVGNTPAELMFDRSVDYISKDELYFGEGQYVKQDGVEVYDSPTVKAEANNYGVIDYPRDASGNYVENYNLIDGDYIHRNMHVKLNSDGKIEELYFDVEDITPHVDENRANRASAAALIDRNSAELDRQSIDAKAGDEKADIWSPFARAIKQNTQVVSMAKHFEAITGNELFLGYRKSMTGMAHQLNRAAKDGQTLVDPAVEALLGIIEAPNATNVLADKYKVLADVLDTSKTAVKKLNSAGSAGLMVGLFDSTGKYTTKQDLLLQPRSFRMHLQTADNNMNPLRVHKRFAQAVDATEVYSTIDRDYDPMLPICITDKAAIIHRYNFNQLFAKIKGLESFTFKTGVSGSTTFVKTPVIDGKLTTGAFGTRHILHVLQSDNTAGHGAFTFTADTFTPNTGMDADVKVLILIDDHAAKYTSITIDGSTWFEQQNPINLKDYAGKTIFVNVPNDVDDQKLVLRHPLNCGQYTYVYSDLRNQYVVNMNLPLIQGLIDWIENVVGAKLYSCIYNGELNIPMVHSTEYFSLWSLMLCAATPYIINARINAMRDVLYYEKNVEYPFSQLEAIGNIGLKSFSNFHLADYDSAIEVGQMKPAAALRWTLPEMFWKPAIDKTGSATTSAYVVMPLYMNQENYVLNADGTADLDEDKSAMTMPSIRSGARLAFLDNLYGMTEKDIRLSYDCALPFVPQKAGNSNSAFVYKYGANTDGIMGFVLQDAADADISIHEWLSQPRELGFVIDAPYGVLTRKVVSSITTAGTVESVPAGFDESATRGTSFRIRCYCGKDYVKHTTDDDQQILDTAAINVNRAANFSQVWYDVVANGKRPDFDAGMIFSMNQLLHEGSLREGVSIFTPFYNEKTNSFLSDVTAMSFMKALWTRIQKLPFIVSPFDGADNDVTQDVSRSVDPYDLAYYFGLCGFRASDYRESVYNREKEVVNQGYLFVNDPWVIDSPIFREGAVSTGISVTRGYEV